ncbi:MAG: pantetheine-phosphate adenylyltransferase [Gammaproteobacteria bacterium]|nr:MAG: pantetheine-phosphate adenylyltransferase [Gammaproteobacteria bacterium]
MSAVAVYSGTFDPITNGHADIAIRAANIFDKVIVAIADFPGASKKPIFTGEERLELAKTALVEKSNIEVITFSSILIDFVKEVNAKVIIRGIRSFTDFDYEAQLSGMNNHLDPEIETVYMNCTPELGYISSTLVKEVAFLGRDVSDLLHPVVAVALAKRVGELQRK